LTLALIALFGQIHNYTEEEVAVAVHCAEIAHELSESQNDYGAFNLHLSITILRAHAIIQHHRKGHSGALADAWNAIMHAENGNREVTVTVNRNQRLMFINTDRTRSRVPIDQIQFEQFGATGRADQVVQFFEDVEQSFQFVPRPVAPVGADALLNNDQYARVMAAMHNALQHALNGNPKGKMKKAVKEVIVMTKNKKARHKKQGNVKGRGDYTLGTGFANVGGVLGNGLDMVWKKFIGRGPYTVKKNSLASGNVAASFGDDDQVYCHRERFDIVIGSSGYTQTVYVVCSTNAKLFPMMAQLAINFEEIEFLGLIVAYNTTSGSVTTSQALGEVGISANYDPEDQGFTNMTSLLSSQHAISTVPSQNMLYAVECARNRTVLNELYSPFDANLYPLGASIQAPSTFRAPGAVGNRFTTMCNIVVAVQGCPTTNQIGELWITTHIRLRKPRAIIALNPAMIPLIGATLTNSSGSSGTLANPFSFDANTIIRAGTNIPITYLLQTSTTSGTLNWPPCFPGQWVLTYVVNFGTTVTLPTVTIGVSGGVSALSGLVGVDGSTLTATTQFPAAGASTSTMTMSFCFFTTSAVGSLRVFATTLGTQNVIWSMTIAPCNAAFA